MVMEVLMKKTRILLLLMLLVVTLLAACEKKSNTSDQGTEVSIYYLDSKTSALVSEPYQMISKDRDEQIEELLYMLKLNPENLLYKSAFTDIVTVKEFTFNEDSSLTINFEPTYNELSGINEVLCRAAVVKTITQIPEVEFIQFAVNGQPLMDDNENLVGIMTKEDFIDNTGTETKVKLYFTNETGDALVEYVTDITYTGTGSLEELVLEELMKGPSQIGMYPTIPEGTDLLEVEMKEGVCYVDFSDKFMEKIPELEDEIVIYSIVNTLIELPYISKVQFIINGEVQPVFGDGMTFDGFFERNLSLIDES
jgi:germination protein M